MRNSMDWKIGFGFSALLFAFAIAAGEPAQAAELNAAPEEAHKASAAVWRVTGEPCPVAKPWVDVATNDLWIDCGEGSPVYVWEAHTGDLFEYRSGWGEAFARRGEY